MSVKLSIGTAVYNVGEDYLRANIESIAKQLTDETELLLIDDCSTDNSGEICREYAAADDRIRYIKMEKNGGLSCVRNRTISEAKGKWVFFADGDDILSEHFIKTALAFSDTDYDIIIHERAIFSGEKGKENDCTVTGLTELPEGAGRELSLSCLCLKLVSPEKLNLTENAYYHSAWGALYRRDFLLSNGLKFPEGQKKAQDSVFNTYAYFYARKIAYLPYVMYYYRKDMQGITQRYSANFAEMITSLLGHHNKCIETLYNNDEGVKEIYKNNRVITFVLDAMRLSFFHKDNPEPRKKRKKEFLSFVNSEPYKSAIDGFDVNSRERPGWRSSKLPVTLVRKEKFNILNIMYRHPLEFRFYEKLEGLFKRN